ncbi:MAG: DUF1028 domain-containing protein [Thiomonas sp.]|nr:DUF1028 domain-containing protein [Thiomonas sp.]
MTWSILARDEDGSFGVAIASRFFAVGSLCVHTRSQVGAVSTQALMNPFYGPTGLAAILFRYVASAAADGVDGALRRDGGVCSCSSCV